MSTINQDSLASSSPERSQREYFSSPIQEEIFRLLAEQIGDGAALNYRDACRLLREQPPFATTTHLVAHLLREIQGAILDVMTPQTYQPTGNQDHKGRVRAILEQYEIDQNTGVGRVWLEFADSSSNQALHKQAHRNSNDFPRQPDTNFIKTVEGMELLLTELLKRFRTDFSAIYRRLDGLIAKSDPSERDVAELRNKIPNNFVSLEYFYSRLTNPAWIEPLYSKGEFFNYPPSTLANDVPNLKYPVWPPSLYLKNVASSNHHEVNELLLQLYPVDNTLAQHSLIDVILSLPSAKAAMHVSEVIRWSANSAHSFFFYHQIDKLLEHLISGNELDAARKLFIAYITDTTSRLVSEPSSTTHDGWELEEVNKKYLGNLLVDDGLEVIKTLLESLVVYLNEKREIGGDGVNDGSFIWLNPLPEFITSSYHRPNEVLASACYYAARRVLQDNPQLITQVVEILRQKNLLVCYRISAALLEQYADDAIKSSFADVSEKVREYERREYVGPTRVIAAVRRGPKTDEEVAAMSLDELIHFIGTWEPDEDRFFGDSVEGMSDAIKAAIEKQPEQFFSDPSRLADLSVPYLFAPASALQNLAYSKKQIPWVNAVRWMQLLLKENSQQLSQYGEETDWAYHSVARVLREGFIHEEIEPPANIRDDLWSLICSLLEKSSRPSLSTDESGAYTQAMNSLRGSSLEAAITYGLWMRRKIGTSSELEKTDINWLQRLPELETVLTEYLDPSKDGTVVTTSIYGRYLPWLSLLSKEWFARNEANILPPDDNRKDFWLGVWDAYIRFCRPYIEVLRGIESQYLLAIQRTSFEESQNGEPSTRAQKLAEHVDLLLIYGAFTEGNDTVLQQFYSEAPEKLRAHAIETLGRILSNEDSTFSEQQIVRLRSFWEWRVTQLSSTGKLADNEELASFGMWFVSARFDDAWSLNQLELTLEHTLSTESAYQVVKRLRELSHLYPGEVLRCLQLLTVRQQDTSWRHHLWLEDAHDILKQHHASESTPIASLAKQIANELVTQGQLQFLDVAD